MKPAFRVLVTRPKQQSQSLCQLIQQIGGEAIAFPTLEIKPIKDQSILKKQIAELKEGHIILFVSPNAVITSAHLFHESHPRLSDFMVVAMGPGTAKTLKEYQFPVNVIPQQPYTSEKLLDTDALSDVQNKHVMIICGEEGRDLIYKTLFKRGAQVTNAYAYEQVIPKSDPKPIIDCFHQQAIDIMICTSKNGLNNLHTLLGESMKPYLLKTPLLVVSQRLAIEAARLGHQSVIVSPSAADEAILKTLLKEI